MTNNLPKLGDRAKDKISGFTGIVDSMHHYLNGCVRVMITSEELVDGKPVGSQIFDISQTEVIEAGVHASLTPAMAMAGPGPGGLRDAPPSREAPSR